jgi:hypothetical protein
MAKRKKAPKRPKLARVRRLTLAAWSRAVRARAGNKCECCGRVDGLPNAKGNPVRLNAHHIEDKANQTLRFDIDNGISLCPLCHKFGFNSAHRSPIWFMEWLKEHLPLRYRHVWALRGTPPPDREGIEALRKKLEGS